MGKDAVKQIFPVLDMSCAACATRVEKTISRLQGVKCATVNFASATVAVEYDPQQVDPIAMKQALETQGYGLIIDTGKKMADEAEKAHAQHLRRLRVRTVWAVILALLVAVIGMFFMYYPWAGWVSWILSTPVVFWLGSDFFVNAWKQLRHRSANMDTLVANSTGIAYLFSVFNLLFPDFWINHGIEPHVYFEASSVIIAFILLGRLLEERAKGQTSSAIKKLMGLRPSVVTRRGIDGRQEVVDVERIAVGDVIVVKPGERIPVDGCVVEGESNVDESMLSGEPMPVSKCKGSHVYAGTINLKGSFCFDAQKVGEGTVLAQIIRMVQDAQGSKAPVQKLVDRIAAVFVPVVMSIAVVAFVLWFLLDSTDGFSHGLLALVTVLIIACPCALGLATPTAIMVGIGKGAENGILIKNAESLEVAGKIDTMLLDKTGTVTEGRPRVTDIVWRDDDAAGKALPVFIALERLSEHPIADAVIVHFGRELADVKIASFDSITGMGVRGEYEGKVYFAGNSRLMADNNIDCDAALLQYADSWSRDAKTVIYFSDDSRLLAVIAVTDIIKPSSAKAVKQLQSAGIEVYMLTGDSENTARHIARLAGIKHYRAEVRPDGKAAFVKQLQQGGHRVAMVGDGINDSAALAQADLGIAMGQGSDIAMDVAQVTILSSDLMKIPETITLSKLTVRTIRQNLFWAFIYNTIGIPVAAGALYPLCHFMLNPMIAGLAMAMSSVSVVSNSLRLKTKRIICDKSIKNNKTMEKEYRIEGMMCDHCRMHVEKALNAVHGVDSASVTLDPPMAKVRFSGEKLPVDVLKNAVEEAGYKIV